MIGLKALRRLMTGLFVLTAMSGATLAANGAAPGDRVVAVVDGYEIRLADVEQARQMLPPEARAYPPEVLNEYVLTNLINTRLVAEAARKQGIGQDAEVRRRIARIEERVLEQEYLIRRVDAEITDAKIRETYDEMVKSTPAEEEVRARHILVNSEALAMNVIERIGKGEDFAAIAKQVSTDGSAQAGGDLGYFTRERMVKPFADAAFGMRPGTVTTRPVRTQFGWHIIKVEDKRTKQPPRFEDVEDDVRAAARRDLAESYVRELREKATIETTVPKADEGAPKGKSGTK